jgi:hypothetical protein
MDARTVIESYIEDVAAKLPRRLRADVTVELRSLMEEEIALRARAAGRVADEAMALELVRGFGRPREVAARYYPAATLIEPAATRDFLVAAVAGVLVILSLALVRATPPSRDQISLEIFAWLGLLFVLFAVGGWMERRQPRTSAWRPRDPDRFSRVGALLLVLVIVAAILCYGAPTWVFAKVTGMARTPAGLARLAYAPAFEAGRLQWLLLVWGLSAALYAWMALTGRWRTWSRWAALALQSAAATVLAWFLAAGPMFESPDVDQTVKRWLSVIVFWMFVDSAVKGSRLVRPAWPRSASLAG